jgi:ketosteroid isomerase-like protein
MSEENVEVVRRAYEAWNGDDFDAWIKLFDPEVEWFALMVVYRGHAGIRQIWESLKGDMQGTVRIDDVRDLGDSVLALGEGKGTGRTTRLNFTTEFAQLVTYRDGRIISIRDFARHAEALEAAGLSE